ncbi:GGDEF domain-containing protein [Noviherbaspirillum aridicola]|uniref:diguanylate cyclase n=1 Tax=Noviherbaspirillum aridicola TaxID=2849687 RepID=A0ABQ4Q2Y7_9BURK|nr:GGDEF domain-containing protein [Noviherbaspirillum aridicola]GIZ51548.1 hypothetical protein NCCP691_15620 [Noviherbaspirillum aridicola]
MRPTVYMNPAKLEPSRSGLEMGLVVYRLCMASLFAFYLLVFHVWGKRSIGTELIALVALYLAYAAVWIAVVRLPLLRLKTRMRTAIFLDQTLLAFALWLDGELIAPIFWAPIAVSLGCGLIGGTFYAKAASAYAAALLTIAFSTSPFWQSLPLIAAGIILATVLLPWHAALLAEHIARGRKDIQRRAAAFELASKTDSLTGVLNRAGFLAALEEQAEKCRQGQAAAVLMLLDLDGFKAVNDAGGHAGGDAVLRAVTRCLQQSLRASDKVARIGGDEFGIIACNISDAGDAEWLAAKLLQAIEGIRVEGSPDVRVTASIGIHPLSAISLDALLETTDRLMYEAKRAGKNQFRSSFDQRVSGALMA